MATATAKERSREDALSRKLCDAELVEDATCDAFRVGDQGQQQMLGA